MGFGLEILLTKLEHIDHKLMELQLQLNHLEEEITTSQCTYGKTSTSTPRKTPKSQQSPFTSCKDIPCTVSGVYLIRINNVSSPFAVYCEMDMFAGGWIVVQHGFDGSVDFYRNWKQYRQGFGDLDGEFWLGLEHIHQLTKNRKFELLVEMMDFAGNHGYARYSDFQVGSESEGYSLKILGSYSGTAGDGMEYSREKKFSTKDRHNDGRTDLNFAVDRKSGWWHSFFGEHHQCMPTVKNVRDGQDPGILLLG
ncbi:angiopoietin-related protein 1-like [Anopheles darlingi]|uniref:angiopoietin-related protein 1-like n=1 Tax=Anopheles darlingi TaxID=43151 RepID=UPI00210011D8|nr:angiopoietin-related protein 1-like [Anopheles darlingi]